MEHKENVRLYIESQRSLHLYKEAREAFSDVFDALPEEDFEVVTKNLILMIVHEGAIAQVMHFEPISEKFKVLQMATPHNIPPEALRWVIAHELGHVMQGRNWQEGDGVSLERDASSWAAKWGFPKTEETEAYIKSYRKPFGVE